MRAGYAAFPISTRNTPAAVAHVLTKSIASHVLVCRDEGLVSLTKSAFALMDGKITIPGTSSMRMFEELYSNTPLEKLDYIRPEKDTPAVILHSADATLCQADSWLLKTFQDPLRCLNQEFGLIQT